MDRYPAGEIKGMVAEHATILTCYSMRPCWAPSVKVVGFRGRIWYKERMSKALIIANVCEHLKRDDQDRARQILATEYPFDPRKKVRKARNWSQERATKLFIRDQFVKTLAVPKVGKAEKHRDNRFSFQVEPEGGIKIFPIERVKV